eukprot:2943475-Pleurochrysis_carterae.AAC.1
MRAPMSTATMPLAKESSMAMSVAEPYAATARPLRAANTRTGRKRRRRKGAAAREEMERGPSQCLSELARRDGERCEEEYDSSAEVRLSEWRGSIEPLSCKPLASENLSTCAGKMHERASFHRRTETESRKR